MSYQAYIVELKSIIPHPNADRLNIAHVFGMNVIIGKEMKVGDVVAYFPSDGQLSLEFAAFNNLIRKRDENGVEVGGYMDPTKRNIKAIKLRGERSDGIIISIDKVAEYTGLKLSELEPGDTFTTLNGKEICKKYVPLTKVSVQNNGHQAKRVSLKNKYPLFQEHKDTAQLAFNMNQFKVGDLVTVSLKLHGTSHRVANTLVNEKPNILSRIKYLFKYKNPNKYKTVSGTRRVIIEDFDKEGGFYGDNGFRKQWNDFFEGKLRKNETVYFEIVGWYGDHETQTIMPIAENKKINDKNFVKQYGEKTTFSYGCTPGQSDIYIYRMTMTNDDGQVVEYPTDLAQIRCEQMGVKHVPVIDKFIVGQTVYTYPDTLFSYFDSLSDGADLIDPSHIREGIVVRIENRETFEAYKHKGFSFKVLESIIKENATEVDMEEAEAEAEEELVM